ncbi:hypothetical protein ACFSJS_21740 [Streptomyces desertarenae]|uniref:Uncharacterized protein n=1 Tax=Streptomyces desertarenae TaxID=2666184 RepID=A0ABW4PPS1_9ACTN
MITTDAVPGPPCRLGPGAPAAGATARTAERPDFVVPAPAGT